MDSDSGTPAIADSASALAPIRVSDDLRVRGGVGHAIRVSDDLRVRGGVGHAIRVSEFGVERDVAELPTIARSA